MFPPCPHLTQTLIACSTKLTQLGMLRILAFKVIDTLLLFFFFFGPCEHDIHRIISLDHRVPKR